MKINIEKEKPAIHVYFCSSQDDSSSFRFLLYGMEEEGIPVVIKKSGETHAIELGYQAALDSNLGVGIGIGEDQQIILHYTKLAKNRPLFQIKLNETYKQRTLGANAARLVKGIPFYSFEEKKQEDSIREEETLSKEEIALIVEIVVEKLKELSMKGGS